MNWERHPIPHTGNAVEVSFETNQFTLLEDLTERPRGDTHFHYPFRKYSPLEFGLRPAFRIYRVQDDGALQFLQATQTLHDAKERVRDLGRLWPGEYVIENEATGDRVFVNTGNATKH
jgi:hypothetical protein